MRVPSEPEFVPDPSAESGEKLREYVLSEVQNAELGRLYSVIAELAPNLGDAEFRVLTALTKLFGLTEHKSGRISSRNLAKAAGTAHSSTCRALESLSAKHMIAKRPGTASEDSGFGLTFSRILQIAPRGVPFAGTPPSSQAYLSEVQGVPFAGTPPSAQAYLSEVQGVPFAGTPPSAQAYLSEVQGVPFAGTPLIQGTRDARASIDQSIYESDSIIDRVIDANPKRCDPVEIREVKRCIHEYQRDFGKDRNVGQPDDKICAELIAIAPVYRIFRLIEDLRGERKRQVGDGWAWYRTVALDRIHQIRPAEYKARVAERREKPGLRVERKNGTPGNEEQQHFPAPEEKPSLEIKEAEDVAPKFGPDLARETASQMADRCPLCMGFGQCGTGRGRSACGACRGTGRSAGRQAKAANK